MVVWSVFCHFLGFYRVCEVRKSWCFRKDQGKEGQGWGFQNQGFAIFDHCWGDVSGLQTVSRKTSKMRASKESNHGATLRQYYCRGNLSISVSLRFYLLFRLDQFFALDSLLKCTLHQLILACFQRDICMDVPNEFQAILVSAWILPILVERVASRVLF